MSDEERTKRKIPFNQIPIRQRKSLEAQLPKISKAKVFGCLLILVALIMIAFNAISDGKNNKPSKPKISSSVQNQQPQQSIQNDVNPIEENKPPISDLGEHWIKDSNEVYIWNPEPQEGESITWSGSFIQDGDYKFADGEGIVTWYNKHYEVVQVDEGMLVHGHRHGRFTHKFFPSGEITHSNWDNGVKIPEPQSVSAEDLNVAKQTFINYHKAITEKNYLDAYNILSYNQRQSIGDPDSYVSGFVDTISSEVSDINLIASASDSCTFEYTLTAHDRYQGNKTKVQIFKGEVTMLKDTDRWYIHATKSKKVNERIE